MCTGTHPFIPAPNTARVRVVYSLFGQVVMNVLYWRGTAPLETTELDDLANAVITAWTDNLKPLVTNQMSLQYVEATALDSESAPQRTISSGAVGDSTDPPSPGNVTWATKFSTGLTGRSNRGRMFLVGLTDGAVDGNTIASLAVANFQAAIIGFFQDIETATGLTHVVVSYCNNGSWRTTAVVNPVLSYLWTDNFVDSQRRRLTGRGM